jgi:hypothetical protein
VSSSKFSLWIEGKGVLMDLLELFTGLGACLGRGDLGFNLYIFLFSK